MSGSNGIRLVVALMAFLAVASVVLVVGSGNDSDADAGTYTGGSNTSSESNPYTGVSFTCSISTIANDVTTIWVQVGSSVNITVTGMPSNHLHDEDAPSFGLTHSGDAYVSNYTGTLSKTGTLHFYDGYASSTTDCLVFNVVDARTLVNSVSISGSSTVTVGSTITLTATVSPSDGYYTGIWWSVSNGNASLGTETQTSTGATLQLTGVSEGSVQVTATVKGDNGTDLASRSYTVTVQENQVSATSITLSVTPGYDSVTVTAKLNPSSTTTDSVTWTRSSGSAGSITSEDSLSATVSLDDYGTVTIRATADDASKRSASITIRVSELSFNANGGSGAPPTILYGQSTTSSHSFTIPISEPYRSGFTFLGWSTSSSGNATYDPGDTISISSSSYRTLYAVWGGDATITFHANGGSGGPGSETYYDIKASGTTAVSLPSSIPTRSGYTFLGWGTSSGSTSASYGAGDTYYLTAGDSDNLYAIWGQRSTISYNVNGGNGSIGSTSVTIAEGSSEQVQITSSVPTSNTQEFLGWCTNSSGTGTVYQPGANYTLYSGDSVTLYAKWGPITYTLKFDIGNGSGSFSDRTSESSTGTCSFKLDGRTPTAPSGYEFIGWSNTSGGPVAYDASGTVSVSLSENPKTIYAVYELRPTYTLSFDAKGGSGAPSSIDVQSVDGKSTFTIPSTIPTKTGYDFLGWSLSENAVSATYQPNGTITLTESDTLYAVWTQRLVESVSISAEDIVLEGGQITVTATVTPADALQCGVSFTITSGNGSIARIDSQSQNATGGTATVTGISHGTFTITATATDGSGATASKTITVNQRITITYNANGGSGAPASHYEDTSGDSTSIQLSSTEPVWDGYIFQGWSHNNPYAEEPDYQPGQTYSFNMSTTLYAVWEPEVILVTSITMTGASSVTVGQTVTITATGLPPTADERGVTFTITVGGALAQIDSQTPTDTGGTVTIRALDNGVITITATANDDSGITATKNITIEQVLTIDYDVGEGSGAPQQQSYTTSGDTHTFIIPSTTPARDGFEFMGWSTTDGGESAYQPGMEIEVNGPTTLHAVWAEIFDYTLTYDIGEGSGAFGQQTYSGIETSHTFAISSDSPMPPDGYTFEGWSTTDGGDVEYQPGQQYIMDSEGTATLYAVYEQITYEHVLIYDANGGSGGPGTVRETNPQQEHTFTISDVVPTPPEGYIFLGWADTAGAEQVQYTSGDSISVTDTKTIYAIYSLITYEHILIYDANGGSGGPGTDTVTNTSVEHSYDVSSIEPVAPDGYRFIGWADSKEATEADYIVGGSISVTDTKTVYAIYEIITYEHKLIYNPNGGEGGPGTDSKVDTSISYRFEISSDVPVKSGYAFVGWAYDPEAEEPDLRAGDRVTVEDELTLYAVWREAIITITSEMEDVEMMSGDSFTYFVETDADGVDISFQSTPEAAWLNMDGGRLTGVPSRDDAGTYQITITASKDGWTSDTQTFSIVVENSVHVEPPVAGAGVYYTGTSDGNSHKPMDGYIDLGTFYGYELTFEFAGSGADSIIWRIVGPETDIELDGWVEPYVFTEKGEYAITQTVTNDFEHESKTSLVLRLVIAGYPVVSFETFGGTDVGQVTVDSYGSTLTKPEDPERRGYVFDGWYTDPECKIPYNFANPVKSNMVLYAGWTADQSVTPEVPEDEGDDEEGGLTQWVCIILIILTGITAVAAILTRNLYVGIVTAVLLVAAIASYLVWGGPL